MGGLCLPASSFPTAGPRNFLARVRSSSSDSSTSAVFLTRWAFAARWAWLGAWFAIAFLNWGAVSAAETRRPMGQGDPGVLVALSIGTAHDATENDSRGDAPVVLIGNERRQQLVVTGTYSSGQVRDLTRRVAYRAEPTGIVSIDGSGLVSSCGNGTATVIASISQEAADAITDTRRLTVQNFERNPPVNFPNQVVPIFTKLQ